MFILLHAMCYVGSVHLLHVFSVAEQLLPSVKGCLQFLALMPCMVLQVLWQLNLPAAVTQATRWRVKEQPT